MHTHNPLNKLFQDIGLVLRGAGFFTPGTWTFAGQTFQALWRTNGNLQEDLAIVIDMHAGKLMLWPAGQIMSAQCVLYVETYDDFKPLYEHLICIHALYEAIDFIKQWDGTLGELVQEQGLILTHTVGEEDVID